MYLLAVTLNFSKIVNYEYAGNSLQLFQLNLA